MKAAVFLVAVVACVFAAVDPATGAQCEDWVLSNMKNMVIVNQVAKHSSISSCAEYCTVVGSGWRADTTVCRHLCETAGGYKPFSDSLSLDGGMASPADICKQMLNPVTTEDNDVVSLLQVEVEPAVQQRQIGVRGDMTIMGSLSASVLTSPIGDVRLSGDLSVVNSIEANQVRAATIRAKGGVSVSSGIESKKDQLLIKSKIEADSVTADGELAASFLELNGVRQWALHSLEDFEETGVDGWSHGEVTQCGGHSILGGHCVEKDLPELSKTFENLPEHSQIRISAKYMFIDSWDGESGYLKVDGNTVWVDTYNHAHGEASHGINVCGNATPERKLSTPVDVTIPHTGSSLTVAFGATTDEHPCDESFGIDSVMVFVR